IALAIKLTSKGPVFFLQERIGRNGRKFKMVKFRSMYADAEKRLKEYLDKNEASGPIFKMKHDPRITGVGKFLRRFSLDELPQIFNVLVGQMSLVGPRPPLEREIVKYKNWQLKRIDVTPGMTGLWQVSGRSDLPFDKMAELDIYYIEHWSIWLDIKILFKTIPAVISGRGAY
ncbi:exopolysaccharide biosynthesis polyprenyl glycosylphosphotransferase, partial [bacterium]